MKKLWFRLTFTVLLALTIFSILPVRTPFTGSIENLPWSAGAPSTYSYTIDSNTTHYFAFNSTGFLQYSGTDIGTIMNDVLANGLTSGRVWKEKVLLKGNFVITTTITLSSYIVLQLDGKVTLANGANVNILSATNKSNIEILGGEWDGNKANQNGDLRGFYFSGCSDVLIRDTIIHDIDQTSTGGRGISIVNGNQFDIDHVDIYNCGDIAYSSGGMGITLNGNNSKVRFCTVHNCLGGIYIYADGSQLLENNQIIANRVFNNYRDGISIYPAGGSSTVRRCGVSENIIYDNSQDGVHTQIKFGDSLGGLCVGNTIEGNLIYETGAGNYGGGIITYANTKGNNIIGNTFLNLYGAPLNLAGSNNSFTGNAIDTVRNGNGIYVATTGDSNSIKNNDIINTDRSGIEVHGDRNLVIGNRIDATVLATAHGIAVSEGDNNVVGNNYIYNVGHSGISLSSDADNNFIDGNYINTATLYGIRVYSADCNSTVIHSNFMINITDATEILDNGTGTIIKSNYQDEDGWVA